jgi:nucleotide-binding universal stress UspA family protein
VAHDEGALAIVVGPSQRGPLGQIMPGSVGERLPRGASCPVAVAPRGYRSTVQGTIASVGVGYVALPEADEALRAAVGLAARTGAAVRVMNVIEPSASNDVLRFGWSPQERETTARDELGAQIRRATDGVTTPVEIAGEVVDGYADDELAQLSREVDLLICGSSGHRPVSGMVLGSVSTGVLRKAHCPLLVVPRGARNGFAATAYNPSATAA